MKQFYTSVERRGNVILHTYYDESGTRRYKKEKFKPYLFIDGKDGEYEFLMDRSRKLTKKRFSSISEQTDWLKQYKDVSGFRYFGMENVIGQFLAETYPGKIEFDKSLINMASFDIETDIDGGASSADDAEQPITCISAKSSKSARYWLFYYEDQFLNDEQVTGIEDGRVLAVKAKDEADMLKKFIRWWANDFPDVLTGWNIDGYDVPYTVNRIRKVLGETFVEKLSPWGYVTPRAFKTDFGETNTYNFSGISIVDYMDIFKKFGELSYGKPPSYKLDDIAFMILGDNKVDYAEEYGDLNGLWKRNKNLYYQYNVKDTILIQRFEDEAALMGLVYNVAYSSGVTFIEALGTVFLWDNIINRYCLEQNIVIPSAPKISRPDRTIEGGYVKFPQVGFHKNVVSFDLNSLYPHLMMQYNISPETFLGHAEGYSPDYFLDGGVNETEDVMCANGARFTREFRGIIPKLIEEKYARRKAVKKEMLEWEQKQADGDTDPRVSAMISSLDGEQLAIKVQMNGLYGAMCNVAFRYFKLVIGEGITLSGQLSVKWSGREVNQWINDHLGTKDVDYLIYTDTDSIYLNLDPIVRHYKGDKHLSRDTVETFIDDFCKEHIEGVIADSYKDLATKIGAFENKMKMGREKICGSAIFVKKKRYCLLVYNSEGVHYPKPKVAVTGIEAVRSNTPAICRKALMNSFEVMLTEGEENTQKYFEEFKEQFFEASVGQIGRITGVKGIADYRDEETGHYQKGCPVHVRASYVYNKYVDDLGLNNKYEPIRSGDKIKYVYLKMPNPVHENVIAFVGDRMPKEFGLEKYVDTHTQFDKTFVSPISKVMEACGWSAEKQDTLEDFFM